MPTKFDYGKADTMNICAAFSETTTEFGHGEADTRSICTAFGEAKLI